MVHSGASYLLFCTLPSPVARVLGASLLLPCSALVDPGRCSLDVPVQGAAFLPPYSAADASHRVLSPSFLYAFCPGCSGPGGPLLAALLCPGCSRPLSHGCSRPVDCFLAALLRPVCSSPGPLAFFPVALLPWLLLAWGRTSSRYVMSWLFLVAVSSMFPSWGVPSCRLTLPRMLPVRGFLPPFLYIFFPGCSIHGDHLLAALLCPWCSRPLSRGCSSLAGCPLAALICPGCCSPWLLAFFPVHILPRMRLFVAVLCPGCSRLLFCGCWSPGGRLRVSLLFPGCSSPRFLPSLLLSSSPGAWSLLVWPRMSILVLLATLFPGCSSPAGGLFCLLSAPLTCRSLVNCLLIPS